MCANKNLINKLSIKHIITIYIHIYIISRRSITPHHIKYNSKPLDVFQSLYFGSKLPSSGIYIYNDMQNVIRDLRNTAYWIVINKSINETAKRMFKDNPIEYIQCPEFFTTPVVIISGTTSTELNKGTNENRRSDRKFWTLYIFYWFKVSLNLCFAVSFLQLLRPSSVVRRQLK